MDCQIHFVGKTYEEIFHRHKFYVLHKFCILRKALNQNVRNSSSATPRLKTIHQKSVA